MISPYVNFISYNSTGMNDFKAKWINDLIVTTKASFIGVQEHFKTTNLTTSFDNWFPEHKHFAKPGHRELGQDKGRAKGGLLQLINKSMDIKVKPVKCENFRVQAQLLYFTKMTLLWINVYMPIDAQNLVADPLELIEVTNTIESIMDRNKFSDVIIQGDINGNPARQSAHSVHMHDFVTRIGLKSVWDKFNVNFTHIHTDLKSTAVLDYFLVNEGLFEYIEDAGVMHLGDNLSRHSPIMLKLNIKQLHRRQAQVNIPQNSRPIWYKAIDQDINDFANYVHNGLQDIGFVESLFCSDINCSDTTHKLERDDHMLNILFTLIESS